MQKAGAEVSTPLLQTPPTRYAQARQQFVGFVTRESGLLPLVIQVLDGVFLQRPLLRRDLARLSHPGSVRNADVTFVRREDDSECNVYGVEAIVAGGFLFYFDAEINADAKAKGCVPLEGARIRAHPNSDLGVEIKGDQIPPFQVFLTYHRSRKVRDEWLKEMRDAARRSADAGGLSFLAEQPRSRRHEKQKHVLSATQHLLVTDDTVVRIKCATRDEIEQAMTLATPVQDEKAEDRTPFHAYRAPSLPLSEDHAAKPRDRGSTLEEVCKADYMTAKTLMQELKFFDEDRMRSEIIHVFNQFVYVITQFPMVLVFRTINLVPPNWAPYAIFLCNVLIWVLPYVLVNYYAVQQRNRASVTVVIWLYLSIFLGPVVLVILRLARSMKSKDCVPRGTFCMRPSAHLRFNTGNLLYIAGMVIEFCQLSLYNLPSRYFSLGISESSNDEDVDEVDDSLWAKIFNFRAFFWGTIAVICFNFLILVLRVVLEGTARHRLESMSLIWTTVNFVSAPMFVSICTICIQALSCDYSDPDNPRVWRSRDLRCWEGEHQVIACASLTGLSYYLIQVSLLPTATYKESIRNEKFDVLFVPIYLQMHFIVKGLYCFVYVSLFLNDWIRIITLSSLMLFILVMHVVVEPSPLPAINLLRTTFMCGVLWAGVASLLFLSYDPEETVDGTTAQAMLVTVICAGWLLFFGGRMVQFCHNVNGIEMRVEKALLDLKYQNRESISPRVLEPLIAVSLSKHSHKDQTIAMKRVKQVLWLCGWEHKRVQFQAAWFLCNLCERFEEARKDIFYSPYRSLFLQLLYTTDREVRLEAFAAVANLSAVETPSLQRQFLELRMVNPNLKLASMTLVQFFVSELTPDGGLFATFAAMVVCNVARSAEGSDVLRRMDVVPLLTEMMVSDDIYQQRYALQALGNLMCYSTVDDPAFTTSPVLFRLLQLSLSKALKVQEEALRVLINLSVRTEVAKALNSPGVARLLAPLRAETHRNYDKAFQGVRTRFLLLMLNVKGGSRTTMEGTRSGHLNCQVVDVDALRARSSTGLDETEGLLSVSEFDLDEEESGRRCAEAVNIHPSWDVFRHTFVPKDMLPWMQKYMTRADFTPMKLGSETALATWETWPSKMDLFTFQRRSYINTRVHYMSPATQRVIEIPLRSTLPFLDWHLEILRKPSKGQILSILVEPSDPNHQDDSVVKLALVAYKPEAEFVGTDYFIYRWKASLASCMDSTLFFFAGSIVITVGTDSSNQVRQKNPIGGVPLSFVSRQQPPEVRRRPKLMRDLPDSGSTSLEEV